MIVNNFKKYIRCYSYMIISTVFVHEGLKVWLGDSQSLLCNFWGIFFIGKRNITRDQ